MSRLCPLCGQRLPEALDVQKLQQRIQKLATPALVHERHKLEEDYKQRLASQQEAIKREAERKAQGQLLQAQRRAEEAERRKNIEIERLRQGAEEQAKRGAAERQKLEAEFARRIASQQQAANREAERTVQKQLSQAQKRAEEAERQRNVEIQRLRRESEGQAKRAATAAVKNVVKIYQVDLEKLQAAREKDRARYEADRARLQWQLDSLSQKLEKQTGEQLGKEAEEDLFAQLTAAFPSDRIERIGKGVKGADILQEAIEDSKAVGRIVWESKNVANWQNSFIVKAKQYRTQYDTPNVLISARVLPGKKKGLCVFKGIPVVEPRMAVALARIIREGVVEIAHMRLTRQAQDRKAQELFDYIVSNKFGTRFKEIAESVASLRERLEKEKDWHGDTWAEEAKLHDRIEDRRRDIESQIKAITRGAVAKPTLRLAARA